MTRTTRRPRADHMQPEQLPTGRWRARVWNPIARTRETVKNTAPGSRGSWPDYASADAAILRREAELDGTYEEAGVAVSRLRRSRTFGEYAALWQATLGGELTTRNGRASAVRILTARFGDLPIEALTVTDVAAWLDETRHLAPRTRAQRLSILSQILRRAMRDGLRTDNPTEEVSWPSVPKTRRVDVRYLSEAELSRALDAAPWWFRPAILLAHDCGLRAGEVAGLRWMRLHLDGDRPSVTVTDVIERDGNLRDYPKGKMAARLPLTPRTVEALRALATRRPGDKRGDHVIRSGADTPILPQYVGTVWRRTRARAELTDEPVVKFHHLRHSAATNLALAGAQAPTIQKLLRHATLAISQTYIDEVSDDALREAMDAVTAHRQLAPVVPITQKQAG